MEDTQKILDSCTLITAAQVFSRVAENIRNKQNDNSKDSVELKFLKEKILSHDVAIGGIAGSLLLKLVRDKILPLHQTLAEIIVYINTTRSYASLTNVLGDLLYLEYELGYADNSDEFKNNAYAVRNKYNLCSPQHPFITLLIEHPDCWNLVLHKIQELQDKHLESFDHSLFISVYLFSIYSPVQNFKHKLWHFLSSSKSLEKNVFYELLCWLQIKNGDSLHLENDILIDALSSPIHSDDLDLLLLWQTSLLYELVSNRMNVSSTIRCLQTAASRKTNFVTDNCVILILSKIIVLCSPVDLKDICNLCETLIHKHSIEPYILDTLRSSLLQWLAISPCLLIEEAYKSANNIFNRIHQSENPSFSRDTDWKKFTKDHEVQFTANSNIAVASELFSLSQCLRDEKYVLEWLVQLLENCPNSFLGEIFHFLCGLLLNPDFNSEITLKVFSAILKCVDHNANLSSRVLILILYKLSNCSDPRVQFLLLRALPKMVVLKENIPKVMAALQALSQDSEDLFNLSLSLMYEAWKIDNKCYPYLEKLLVTKDFPKKKWERYVAKTYVIKQLCQEKPQQYGTDMVAHISKILNDCDDDNEALPSALAIEAITILCREEVIDIKTTWNNLLPKFKNDLRVPVVKSLCLLIQEIPRLPYTETYTDLYEDVLKALWEYVEIGGPEIAEAALDSLTAFGLQQICPHIPAKYLEEEVAGKPVAGNLVPGKTWMNFLIRKGASTSAVNFITKMISIEIDGYLKYVYHDKGTTREPHNYAYLPTHSIVRSIVEFVKSWALTSRDSIHDVVYMGCLNILSKEYSKPLPPFDWCFLQELMHEPKTKGFCVDIASHQVVLSGTARRLIENYIVAVTADFQEEDVSNIFRNLKHLANSIQPVILKPFFEASIWKAIETHKDEVENKLLDTVFESLRIVLSHPDIQETNKTTVVEVLRGVMFVTDVQSKLFQSLLETLITAPNKCLEKITKLSLNCDGKWLEKMMKLKCFFAKNSTDSSFNWNNEIMELMNRSERTLTFWDDFQEVFKSQVDNPYSALWVLDMTGKIQEKVAERNGENLCMEFDLLISAIVHFSGHTCLLDPQLKGIHMKDLLPQALASLLAREDWEDCTIRMLEWLFHMNTEVHVPSEYRQLFGLSLRALRHEREFLKNQRWMRYLGCSMGF